MAAESTEGRPALLVAEGFVPGKALQVAVENDAYEFPGPVHHRAAGIPADDVAGADEVERDVFRSRRDLLFAQDGGRSNGGRFFISWTLLVKPVESGEAARDGLLSVFHVTFHRPKRQPQRRKVASG